MPIFPEAVLVAAIAFCVLTSLGSGLQPRRFADQLGLSVANSGGANEVRAQYSGFFLALGVLCGAALAGVASPSTALIALIVTFGGLLAGRLTSLALNGGVKGFPPTIVALYFIDAAGLGLALAALHATSR